MPEKCEECGCRWFVLLGWLETNYGRELKLTLSCDNCDKLKVKRDRITFFLWTEK